MYIRKNKSHGITYYQLVEKKKGKVKSLGSFTLAELKVWVTEKKIIKGTNVLEVAS